MNVTSTEFQQNVGHYLALAEKGEEITIQKLKPLRSTFKLKISKPVNQPQKQKSKIKQILEEAKKYRFKGTGGETGLQLQKRVRS